MLAGTLKRLALCYEHPRPLGLVPARGYSFLEPGEPHRKIITVQCHAPYSAIQSENKAKNQGLKAGLQPQPNHDTDESLKIFHRDQDGQRKPIA